MFKVIYLEEKIITRKAFELVIEKQSDCKVVFSTGDLNIFCEHINTMPFADLCIIADCYSYQAIIQIIKCIKAKSSRTYILLKSDAKFIKSICYLMRNGLNGLFFTDEEMIDLKNCVQAKIRFNVSADKTKLITSSFKSDIKVRELKCIKNPLTQNELNFIQACTMDMSYEEIALNLQKSISTIYGYRDRVFRKLAVKQRAAMVMAALKNNYIDL
jgi:DNA-binding NarL/FixJ family response regulator